eukprot:CAMPEP_0170513140 /NCGR_PEP_ID=MMETSP0208-20121228/67236_1 /TAXON_ID=197538 /ORGANISM="Strombidium inclinatum, Strain S3" /LENGTH=149 /DNA_ID=CAMNT_0010796841 /DNA_START=769 /DNA_END=1215 /DNA_ORIENTATION=-
MHDMAARHFKDVKKKVVDEVMYQRLFSFECKKLLRDLRDSGLFAIVASRKRAFSSEDQSIILGKQATLEVSYSYHQIGSEPGEAAIIKSRKIKNEGEASASTVSTISSSLKDEDSSPSSNSSPKTLSQAAQLPKDADSPPSKAERVIEE